MAQKDFSMDDLDYMMEGIVANLRFAMEAWKDDATCGSVVVTSTVAGEGKSIIARRLAEVLAASGKNVVLVEANSRNPVLAQELGVAPNGYLSSVIRGEVSAGQAIVPTAVDGLDLLPEIRGASGTLDLYGTERFDLLFAALSEAYDHVVVDTPDLSTYADAAVIFAQADAALLVVQENCATRQQVADAYELLSRAGDGFIGTVLNRAR